MSSIRSRDYDRFVIELWNRSDVEYIPGEEGVCLVVRTGDQKNHFPIEGDMFDSDKFIPLKSDNTQPYRCYICGNGEGNIQRYQYTGFTLHSDCREEFVEKVRDFLDDSSESIVSKNI